MKRFIHSSTEERPKRVVVKSSFSPSISDFISSGEMSRLEKWAEAKISLVLPEDKHLEECNCGKDRFSIDVYKCPEGSSCRQYSTTFKFVYDPNDAYNRDIHQQLSDKIDLFIQGMM